MIFGERGAISWKTIVSGKELASALMLACGVSWKATVRCCCDAAWFEARLNMLAPIWLATSYAWETYDIWLLWGRYPLTRRR